MKEIIGDLIEAMEVFLGDGKMAVVYAKFVRDMYLALIDTGFSNAEAMEIITRMQMPSAGK